MSGYHLTPTKSRSCPVTDRFPNIRVIMATCAHSIKKHLLFGNLFQTKNLEKRKKLIVSLPQQRANI